MDITVAICTWNRADLLHETLKTLHKVQVPEGVSWEVLVIDNNCTDNTAAVVEQHVGVLPLRRIVEPKQGHSHARNCAVAHASGRLLIWTDDDVHVPEHWLADFWNAFLKYPDAKFFGGPVRPWYEKPPPGWVTRHFDRVKFAWALVDHGPQTRMLTSKEYPCGANLAFPLDVLRSHPFDPNYGRVGKQLSSEDETRVIEQLRAEGGEGVWIGTAAVEHFLPAKRMTVDYVYEISRWMGFYGYRDYQNDSSTKLAGAPRWLWKKYLSAAGKLRIHSLSKNNKWLDALLESARWRGLLDHFRQESRGSRA